jgi:hypothetical protein
MDKPLITFIITETERTLSEVIEMIQKISLRINEFEELEEAIDVLLENKVMFKKERKEVSNILFDQPDGLSGKRAADRIKEFILT